MNRLVGGGFGRPSGAAFMGNALDAPAADRARVLPFSHARLGRRGD
jgi:hypothetical protein